jgi:mono/diheme cytochrome c family protein
LILIKVSIRTAPYALGLNRISTVRMIKFATAMLWLTVSSQVGSAEEMGYGEAEFLNSCAVCHGVEGKGDGPLGDELMKRPADLTRISQRNGGTFPYARVFSIIDGRYVVPGHGEREMPVWGRQFLVDDTDLYGPAGGEIVTNERIHALAGYVESLQRR